MHYWINHIPSFKNQLKMLGYNYNEFQIKKRFYSDTFYVIYKDGQMYSSLACRTVKVAKKVLDRAFPENRHAEPFPILQEVETKGRKPVLTICACGCGETFLKYGGRKKFIIEHNSRQYYINLNNIWNKKIN